MKKIIIGNWKANKDLSSALAWFDDFARVFNMANSDKVEIVVAPAFNLLAAAKQQIDARHLPIKLAVQDLSPMPAGAYTGAVAASNLVGFDVEYALVGHSERRRYFSETSQQVANKVEMAVVANMQPILCVDQPYMMSQASAIQKELLGKCLVAYEPLAAIGSGDNAPVGEVEEFKREVIGVYGGVKFIYGGSVTTDNVNEYLIVSDGVLVGGASLDGKGFAELVNRAVV